MHIHILGICGTFMGSMAVLAKELGHHVTGSDANVYPPMSTQLQAQGIELTQGYDPVQFDPVPDLVVIGNAMSRGNPAVEYVLRNGWPIMCCKVAGCWQSPVLTARPLPAACWPGCWNMPA
jgi:UDP-N-acetylmuramate: L-alanyl-gamma-D-glutamyl-meso-diaminopimelate ligase